MKNVFTPVYLINKHKYFSIGDNRKLVMFGKYLFVILFLFTGISFCQTATAPAAGDGSVGSPYQIATLENLYWLAATDAVVPSPTQATRWTKYYIQTANIDASATSGWDSGSGWTPIGNNTTQFTGNYDGGGFSIDNLTVNRSGSDYQGLFGYVRSGTIKNLGVTNVNISGSTNVGGLVGYTANSSTVTKCFSTGSVNGSTSSIGGLVGYNNLSSSLNNSFSSCNVVSTATSEDWTGGLVGVNNKNSTVTNCYSTGSVYGYNRVGGLVGYYVNSNPGATNCYSTGIVSTGHSPASVNGFIGTGPGFRSFWDTQTSGLSTAPSGTVGKTTALMKTQSTFTDSTWDFTGETTNGTNDYWSRDDNKNGGYPYLSWQTFPNTVTITDGSSFNVAPTSGQTNQPIGRLALRTSSAGAVFNGIWVQLNGTRTGASNFKLWESSDNTFNSISDTQIGSTVAADPGNGNYVWFLSLSKSLATTDKYYFITCDVASNATGNIQAVIVGNKEVMLGLGTLGSTISNASLSSVTSPLPVELIDFSAKTNKEKVELNWRTATEVNNHGFVIERNPLLGAVQGWVKMGFVAGAGNSNSPHSYSFTDQPTGGTSFSYRLKQIDNDGGFKYYDAITVTLTGNQKAELMDNYPNPFNPSTAIKFYIPNNSDVTIKIYDMLGKEVTTLVNQQTEAGYHIVYWNGKDSYGRDAASGVYIYRLTAGSFAQTKKMNLLK